MRSSRIGRGRVMRAPSGMRGLRRHRDAHRRQRLERPCARARDRQAVVLAGAQPRRPATAIIAALSVQNSRRG